MDARRSSFCDVGFGRPNGLDPDEPKHLAESVADLGLKYVVITSVRAQPASSCVAAPLSLSLLRR